MKPDGSNNPNNENDVGYRRLSSRDRQRKRFLIVDGYNVIRSGSRYHDINLPDYTDDYFNVARERLLKDVIDFVGRDMEAVIAYDAGARKGTPSHTDAYGSVKVVFSSRGQSADNLIERLAHDARKRGIETLVVTSDATIQDTVFGGGIDRMSAEGFCQEIESASIEKLEDEDVRTHQKRTIADRIPKDVLEKLEQLRDTE